MDFKKTQKLGQLFANRLPEPFGKRKTLETESKETAALSPRTV